jgi:hypothetical protein
MASARLTALLADFALCAACSASDGGSGPDIPADGSAGASVGGASVGGASGTGAGGLGGSGGAGAIGGSGGSAGTAGGAGSGGMPGSCPSPPLDDIMTFELTHGAFPGSGHPDVAVHVPPGFDPCGTPSLVLFFHGFYNCVDNVLRSTDAECTAGGGARTGLAVAEQLDAAGVNALLVAVELAYDQASDDPGDLAQLGELRAMLDELFGAYLSPLVGVTLETDGFDRVVFASHSGGYRAVAVLLDVGGVEADEVELYDSLYGSYATYADWTAGDVAAFATAPGSRRFSVVWTTGGGTVDLSHQLEADVDDALTQAGLSTLLFYQEETAPDPTPADLAHPFYFKHSGLSHEGVVRYYFERLIGASGIAPVP